MKFLRYVFTNNVGSIMYITNAHTPSVWLLQYYMCLLLPVWLEWLSNLPTIFNISREQWKLPNHKVSVHRYMFFIMIEAIFLWNLLLNYIVSKKYIHTVLCDKLVLTKVYVACRLAALLHQHYPLLMKVGGFRDQSLYWFYELYVSQQLYLYIK